MNLLPFIPSSGANAVRRLTAALLALLLVGSPSFARAQSLEQAVELDPRHEWTVFETSHFEIVHAAHDEAVARKAAAIAERVYTRLSAWIGEEPALPIRIVLASDYEQTNGFSVPFPYNQVQIFLASPRPGSVLADTGGQWLEVLLTHELTHALHLDQVDDLPLLLRGLFGRAPGLGTWSTLAPTWLIEGMGTYAESALTGRGRVGGTLSGAVLRMAALSGAFEPIDRAATFDAVYPGGLTPYLFGSHFIAWLGREYGQDKLAAWIDAYAGGPIPYDVYSQTQRIFGATFETLWLSWQYNLIARAKEQERLIRARGLREGELLFDGKGWLRTPRFAPDGRLVFRYDGADHIKGLYALGETPQTIERLPRNLEAVELVFDPAKNLAYGTRAFDPDPFSTIDQLLAGPWPRGPLKPLPAGAHGREAALSPDGKRLVFVRRAGVHTYLARADTDGGAATPLTPEGEGRDYADPILIAGGGEILVSILEEGRWRLWRLDAATGARIAPLLEVSTGGDEIQPALSPDGTVIAYASDRTGVFNIYLRRVGTDEEVSLTNVLGAALEPQFTPDGQGVVFVSWYADGQKIHAIALPQGWTPAGGDEAPTPFGADRSPPFVLEPRPAPFAPISESEEDETLIRGERPYTPWSTLAPRFWMPQVAFDNNDTLLGAWTASQDLLRHWFYSASAFYGLTSEEPRVFASGGYSRLHAPRLKNPLVFADYSRNVSSFGRAALALGGGGVVVRNVFELRQSVSVGLSSGSPLSIGLLPLPEAPDDGLSYSAGFSYERREDLDGNLIALAAQSGVDPEPFKGSNIVGPFLQLGYGRTRSSHRAVSPEEGYRITSQIEFYHEGLGSDFSGMVASADARLYLNGPQLPYLSHVVFALRGAGGTTQGDRPLTRAFVLGGSLGESIVTLASTRLSLLRGYDEAQFAGDHFSVGNAELRLPLLWIRRGLGNLPIYFGSLHLAGFADVGAVWPDGRGPESRDLALGTGAELVLSGNLGYFIPLSLRVGAARAVRLTPQTEFYVQLGRSF